MAPWQTCIHMDEGLCATCQAEYDEDPDAWVEYGEHPLGIANTDALKKEMEEEDARGRYRLERTIDWHDIPL